MLCLSAHPGHAPGRAPGSGCVLWDEQVLLLQGAGHIAADIHSVFCNVVGVILCGARDIVERSVLRWGRRGGRGLGGHRSRPGCQCVRGWVHIWWGNNTAGRS